MTRSELPRQVFDVTAKSDGDALQNHNRGVPPATLDPTQIGLMHLGAMGIKLHPPNQLFRPDADDAMRIYRWCGDERIPLIWHSGPAGIEPKVGQYCAQMRFYERALRECPGTTFIFGHAGSLQHREAIALQRKYSNVYLEVSGLSLGQLREVLDEADEDRVVFGSDWPFYHPVLPLAKVLIATEGRPALRRKVLHDNAARLLERAGRRD